MENNGRLGGGRLKAAGAVLALAVLFAAAGLNFAELYRAADRQAHLAYAGAAQFAGNLRLVYEVEAAAAELKASADARAAETRSGGGAKPARCSASVTLAR